MNLILEKVTIHHFLSYGDSEIDLRNKGFCVINGINNNPKDKADSNGAGKSTVLSAICYALVGETVQGLKSNLANIYLNDGCWVKLDFIADGNTYSITRYKDDVEFGTDLKITVNGEDKSGKGIRESQEILEKLLPDLNLELLSSVILLGQGLPNKFTNNTPAGRKEILESLSHSDFMIEDIKNRINNRLLKLGEEIRKVQDTILTTDTARKLYIEQLTKQQLLLTNLSKPVTYEEDITKLTEELTKCDNEIGEAKQFADKLIDEKNDCSHQLDLLQQDEKNELDKVEEDYKAKLKPLQETFKELEIKYTTLRREVDKIKSIPNICPTCGQKMPAGMKPSTEAQEKELAELAPKKISISKNIIELEDVHTNNRNTVSNKYKEKIDSFKKIFEDLKKSEADNQKTYQKLLENKSTLTIQLNKITMERDNHQKNLDECNKAIAELTGKINTADKTITDKNIEKTDLDTHYEVVNKMNTLVKREFRGYLLSNIINYIDNKCKEYSKTIFDTTEIEFKLNGNNIDITYCNKPLESLSGGERQKVDIITQLAIRSMLCRYLSFSCNCLFLDEFLDALDRQGSQRVLDLITYSLSDIESVFMISHRSGELNIPTDSEIVVTKDENGISTAVCSVN